MNKLLWSVGILVFGGLAAFAIYASYNSRAVERKNYEPSPLTMVLDMELTKPIQLQVFYLKDKNGKFNEQSSITKSLTPADTHVEVVIPAERIYNFRLDFGSNPERVLLKNIEIKGDIFLNFNNWHDYAYVNISKHKIHHNDNSLELYSRHNDPYMVFQFPFVLDEKK